MNRSMTIAALAAVAISACTAEPEVPQAVAVAMTAPQADADKEVLIASQPTGAKILLKGAEVGATPMKLLIRDDTNVVLEKDGYVKQALMLTPKSDPNVVVTLVPSGEEVAAAEVAPTAAPAEADKAPKAGAAKAGGKKTGKEEDGAGTATGTGAAEPAPAPAEPPKEAAPEPPPKPAGYTTMRQIKDAYRAGKITKADYNYWQGIIRQKRQAEFDQVKKDLRDGKITEAQYEERIRAIKAKYEG